MDSNQVVSFLPLTQMGNRVLVNMTFEDGKRESSWMEMEDYVHMVQFVRQSGGFGLTLN